MEWGARAGQLELAEHEVGRREAMRFRPADFRKPGHDYAFGAIPLSQIAAGGRDLGRKPGRRAEKRRFPENRIDIGALNGKVQRFGAKSDKSAVGLNGARIVDGLLPANVGAAAAYLV